MKLHCLKLITQFLIPISSERHDRAKPKANRRAVLKRLALTLSVAASVVASTKALAATAYTVTTLNDATGACSGTSCTTLRAAITEANNSAGNSINFTGLSGTLTLTGALPTITQSMTITGPGANTLTVSGNSLYQILKISSGTVGISGLTFANGSAGTGNGGAIYSAGNVTVTNSAFSGNSALDFGGAIYNTGALTVTNSMFSGGSASSAGAAIYNSINGVLTVTNSTFSGNYGGYMAAGGGGAISNNGTLVVTGSTFSRNIGNYGGAIYNLGSPATVSNNIFTNNSAPIQLGSGAGILDDKGTVNASNNLYFQNFANGTTEDDCHGCATNTNAITGSNPLLAPLSNYGGPTQSLLPQPGSPAICAGSTALSSGSLTTDQRGFRRTTTNNGTICVDLGAVQTAYTAVAFSSASYSGTVNQALNPAPIVMVTENGQNIGGVSVTLGYSGSGSPQGLGPVITAAGIGSTFSQLTAASQAQGVLSVNLPITASGNPVQLAALTASASLNIPTPTFVIASGSASISMVHGATTGNTVPITVTPSNGFTGTVNLSCSVSPVATSYAPTCSFSPSAVTITGSAEQNSTLTISTTASTTATVEKNSTKWLPWSSTGAALALAMLVGFPRRRRWLPTLCVLTFLLTIGSTGCAGGGSNNTGGNSANSGTSAGTYTITVTGSSGNTTATAATITLVVQ